METSRQIEEAAAAWLARRDRGPWSDADQAALAAWLKVSTARHIAFLRLEAAWRQTRRLVALGAGLPKGVVPPAGAWRHSRFFTQPHGTTGPISSTSSLAASAAAPPRTANSAGADTRPLAFRAVAASFLLAGIVAFGYYFWAPGTSYRTAIGGLEAVPMEDGSRITLNTDSGIRVSVSDRERGVELQQGEAFFEVAKDPRRPFVVKAGDKRIIAVGTKFSVLRAGTDVRVVVTEGRVRVERAALKESEPAVLVSAGSIARAGESGVLVHEGAVPQAEEYLSWRSGFLIFHETTLADAAAEFNRYNTRKILIEDRAVATTRIGGNFRADNLDAFVRLLTGVLPIRAEKRGDQIILMQQ